MTKTLLSLRDEIERGPQHEGVGYIPTPSECRAYATRIALLMAEECARICNAREVQCRNYGDNKSAWDAYRTGASDCERDIRAFAATLTQDNGPAATRQHPGSQANGAAHDETGGLTLSNATNAGSIPAGSAQPSQDNEREG